MTFFYQTQTWNSQPQYSEDQIDFWKHLTEKPNYRIVELPNGYYQTEYRHPDSFAWVDITRRETIEAAEKAINKTIEHYNKKLSFINGPKVVKTFEKK
jgi:hypothetical protein